MTSVSLDFAVRQERYQTARHFMRDVLLRGIAFHSLVKVNVSGLEYIPPSGPTIVMMNHTGGIDPFLMLGVVRPRFVVPMSKVENFKLPVIGLMMKWWGAYPIRRGEVDRAALQNTVDLLKAGNLVLMAPEGTRQPAMIEGKAGLTYVATRADAMIVPVGIEGSRDFMRNLKRLRRSPISLTFGPAFRFKVNVDAGERVPRARLAQMTQEAMYQLARLVTPARRGFYSDLDKATTEWIEFVT